MKALAAVAACLALGACGLLGPDRQQFVVHIDSIAGPSSLSASSATVQRLYGPIGPDGCYRLKSIRVDRTLTSAEVTVLGEHSVDAGYCTYMPVYLDGEPITLAPPISAPFTVTVRQPSGAALTKLLTAP